MCIKSRPGKSCFPLRTKEEEPKGSKEISIVCSDLWTALPSQYLQKVLYNSPHPGIHPIPNPILSSFSTTVLHQFLTYYSFGLPTSPQIFCSKGDGALGNLQFQNPGIAKLESTLKVRYCVNCECDEPDHTGTEGDIIIRGSDFVYTKSTTGKVFRAITVWVFL